MTPARRQADTRPATPADARAYHAKATEFLCAATDSLDHGNRIAATSNAVHAGIAAADAIVAARAGAVWKGEHAQAAAYLERAGGADGRQAARHLRRLLPLKTKTDYDPDPVSHAEARTAVQAAQRMVVVTERVIASIGSD